MNCLTVEKSILIASILQNRGVLINLRIEKGRLINLRNFFEVQKFLLPICQSLDYSKDVQWSDDYVKGCTKSLLKCNLKNLKELTIWDSNCLTKQLLKNTSLQSLTLHLGPWSDFSQDFINIQFQFELQSLKIISFRPVKLEVINNLHQKLKYLNIHYLLTIQISSYISDQYLEPLNQYTDPE